MFEVKWYSTVYYDIETAWATGPVDEWAEAEVETLEELY